MKKIALGMIILSTLSFSNDFEKQIPEILNKMLEQFNQKNFVMKKETKEAIIKDFIDKKNIFCESKFQRTIVNKKNYWTLDKHKSLFINESKGSYFYINECRTFKIADKLYL